MGRAGAGIPLTPRARADGGRDQGMARRDLLWGGGHQVKVRPTMERWEHIGIGCGIGLLTFVGLLAVSSALDALRGPAIFYF